MRNKYLILFFGAFIFSMNTYAQLSVEKKEVRGSVSYGDVKYSYNAYVNFKITVQGALEQDEIIVYRNVEGYEINSYTYKGVDASDVGYSYPIAINRYKNKVFVDIQFYKGNRNYTAKGLEPDGSYYLRDSQKRALYSTFNIDPKKKDCITCPVIQEVKNLNVKALNVKLSDLTYLNLFSEINNKIEDKLRREKEEKRLKEEEERKAKKEEQLKEANKNDNLDKENKTPVASKPNEIETETSERTTVKTESIYERRQREAAEAEDRKKAEEQRKLEEFQRFKKAQEAELKRKQVENKAIADAAAGFAGIVAGGAADGIFSGINIGLTSRDYNTGKSGGFDDGSRNVLSYDLGITMGKGAFSVGYVDSGEGGFLVGLDYDVLQLGKERYDRYLLRVNVSGEFGFGDETFYGGYLNLRIFEILYLGYGIGQIEIEEPKFSGSYQGFRLGFHFNF